MPLTSKVNQYFGINPHANGYMQQEHDWRPFHARYIIELTNTLNDTLPPRYIAVPKASLQIEQTDPTDVGSGPTQRPRPDTTIFDKEYSPNSPLSTESEAMGTSMPAINTMYSELTELNAAVIYETDDHSSHDRPVARIEVLSPTNKPPFSSATQYKSGRTAALMSGLPLVEIDFLNQQRSVNAAIPNYPDDAGSKPYSVTIYDLKPSTYEEVFDVILFGVDEPIPAVRISLSRGYITDPVDLDAAYQSTFAHAPELQRQSDYTHLPADFDLYSQEDQSRITRRMETVQSMHEQNVPLERGPFPLNKQIHRDQDDRNLPYSGLELE